MPWDGLYPTPRQRLYGGQMSRALFNSNDFSGPYMKDFVDGQPSVMETLRPITPKDAREADREEKRKRKEERRRRRSEKLQDESEIAVDDPSVSALVAGPVEQAKSEKKKRKSDEQGGAASAKKKRKHAIELSESAQTSPAAKAESSNPPKKRKEEGDPSSPKKQRKHHSDAGQPSKSLVPRGAVTAAYVQGDHFVDKALVPATPGHDAAAVPPSTEKLSRKQKKHKSDRHSLGLDFAAESSSTDIHKTAKSSAIKKHKDGEPSKSDETFAAASLPVKTPRKTPVPLPTISAAAASRVQENFTTTTSKDQGSSNPITPVPKSNKSRLTQSFDVKPQPKAQAVTQSVDSRSRGPHEKSKPSPPLAEPFTTSVDVQATTAVQQNPAPESEQTAFKKRGPRGPYKKRKSEGIAGTPEASVPAPANTAEILPGVHNALTDGNLERHTKPTDSPLVLASESPVSTRSIPQFFARASRSVAHSSAKSDVTALSENRIESTLQDFNERFRHLQKAVNFTDELAHLDDFLSWTANSESEPPCLGNMTGCNQKKEQILQLGKGEGANILQYLEKDSGDPAIISAAAQRCRSAQEMLMLSLCARTPMSIGRLEGVWTLFSPCYAARHFDKYGFGQRTLVISAIAGFRHENSYTARLNIPPRSMSYSLLAFSTPPHASFRTTTVTTAAEGYTMELIFLGNGYLHLRVDLNLLLKGKATEESSGKKVQMEFIGLHEKAVKWWRGDV